MNETITPSLESADLFAGKEYSVTPTGTYRMALAGDLKVKKTMSGERKLQLFFKHIDAENKGLKGVNLSVMLEGTDKNGRPKAKQFGDTLVALGVATDDVTGGNVSVEQTGELEAGNEWKGATARILIRGDAIDLRGREAIVKVEESTNKAGAKTSKATAAYRAK